MLDIERTLFVMADFIVIIILMLLIGSAAAYMIRAKKNGVKWCAKGCVSAVI